MDIPAPYHLHASLGYLLSLNARIQERRLDEALRTLGLTRITWCMLLAVGFEGHEHPSEIADFVGIDRTATSRALRQMESAGLIERRGGDGDRRTTRVSITPAGETALRRALPMAEENNARICADLTPGEQAELARLLHKVSDPASKALARL